MCTLLIEWHTAIVCIAERGEIGRIEIVPYSHLSIDAVRGEQAPNHRVRQIVLHNLLVRLHIVADDLPRRSYTPEVHLQTGCR
jgi:hypothetical protein